MLDIIFCVLTIPSKVVEAYPTFAKYDQAWPILYYCIQYHGDMRRPVSSAFKRPHRGSLTVDADCILPSRIEGLCGHRHSARINLAVSIVHIQRELMNCQDPVLIFLAHSQATFSGKGETLQPADRALSNPTQSPHRCERGSTFHSLFRCLWPSLLNHSARSSVIIPGPVQRLFSKTPRESST